MHSDMASNEEEMPFIAFTSLPQQVVAEFAVAQIKKIIPVDFFFFFFAELEFFFFFFLLTGRAYCFYRTF